VAAVVVTLPGSKCSSTYDGAIMALRGRWTSARNEESTTQAAGTPEEGTGPILAEQLKVTSGRMKLYPDTVTDSPTNGDGGETLSATGTSDMKMGPESTGAESPVSGVVCTVTPVGEPSVAAPIARPEIVTWKGAAASNDAALK
jgi:hypothetical protein